MPLRSLQSTTSLVQQASRPVAEQHPIVAEVDTLMAFLDQLEASLTATATTRRRLLDMRLAKALVSTGDRELEAVG